MTLFCVLMTATLAASDVYPPPRFTDPGRVAKLQSAMPEIDRVFRAYATARKIPGMILSLLPAAGRALSLFASIRVLPRVWQQGLSPA